jgi:RNA polymerase sigma-70 factor (ECF subfamily)
MTPEQERQAVQRAQKNPRAFVQLYDHYFPRVHAYVRYRVPSAQDAEDLLSDTFFKAIRRLDSFQWRHEASFAGWLFRIAHNLIADYYRQVEPAVLSLESSERLPEMASRAPQPVQILTEKEAFQHVRALIATLPPRRQEVITLKFFGGLRNREIAAILGLDERTIASHLSRGLRDLERRYAAPVRSHVMAEETL